MIEITSEKMLSTLDEKWKKFKPYLLDKLYNSTEELYVKTSYGSVYQCSLQWQQGYGNNYFFGDIFGNDDRVVRIESVTHYIIKD